MTANYYEQLLQSLMPPTARGLLSWGLGESGSPGGLLGGKSLLQSGQPPESAPSQPPDNEPPAANQWMNRQIDQARRTLEALGLTREELQQRTQRIGDGGHVNPNFDPELASLAQWAVQRMAGPDPDFIAFSTKYFSPAWGASGQG